MKIETKFDIGQKIYTIEHREVKEWNIRSIQCNVGRENTHTFYEIESDGLIYVIWEEHLFSTREEAENKLKEM